MCDEVEKVFSVNQYDYNSTTDSNGIRHFYTELCCRLQLCEACYYKDDLFNMPNRKKQRTRLLQIVDFPIHHALRSYTATQQKPKLEKNKKKRV